MIFSVPTSLLPDSSRSDSLPSPRPVTGFRGLLAAAARLGAMCLPAALAAAAMLPAQADAGSWTSPKTGYKFTWNHVTEGNDVSFTIELVDAKGRGLPENTRVYTQNGTTSGYAQATAGTDYTAYDQTHSFSLNTSITVSISTTQDETIEGDEGFYLYVQPGGSGNDKARVFARINNDDVGTITISDASVNEGGTVTFTAKHTGKAAAYDFSAVPTYTNGTAESGDYTKNTTSLSFSGALNEEKTFTVSTTQDAVLETNETVTVGFSISGQDKVKYGKTGVGGGSATLTINNEDSATVTVNDASASEGEDITFTLSLNNAVEGGLTVTPSYTNGTAGSSDYTENTSGVDFDGNAGETQTFTVSTTEDTDIEDNETFTVGLSTSNAPSGVTSTDTGTGTINDDEDKPYVVVNSASVDEGDSGTTNLTFTARLVNGNGHTLASKQTVTAGYSVLSETGNTATAGTDYTTKTGTITFAPDETSKTIDVSVSGDETVEADETLTWKWTSWTNSSLASWTYTGTIKNDDSAEVTIDDASVDEGGDMTFTVTLSEKVAGGLTVTPTYTNGTAASTDYKTNTNDLSFSGDKGETKTFKVTTEDDAVFEGDETFTVGLTVSGTTLGSSITSTDTGTGTINNDDSAEVTINDASASEGDSLTFTVTLSEQVQGGLTVTPDFSGGNAVEGTDYTANTTGLSFSGTKGETKSFKVATEEDAVLESDETFTVGLTVSDAPSGVTSTDTGTGTIDNDDSAEVTIADAEADEGDDITFTITLDEAVQGGLTVTPDFTDGTAAEGTDYDENTAAISFTGTKGETQTFTVSTDEDAVLESDETFTVGLTASGAPSGTSVTDTDEATGTIDNDDSAEVTIADAEADEGDAITFTVTLDEAVQGGLTVTPDFTDGTAAEGTDYDENTTALTFSGTKGETQTFTVSTTEDAVLEADETFTVGLTASDAPAGTSVTATDEATGTVGNDDGATVTINDASASEGESMTFTVTLGAAVQGGLTVTPDFTDVSAVEGTDYDDNTAALTFTGTANETQTFTVSTTEDAVLEADETFTVGLTASDEPAGTSVTDTDTGTGTVNNDDSAEVTIDDAEADEGESMTFTVTLSAAVQDGLTVTPDFTDVTAVEGTDYDDNTAALSFTGTKGETKSFTVSTTEDAVLESDETFTVGLSVSNQPTGTTVTDTDEGTGTIDNDDSSEVTVNDAEADEGDGIAFTVTLSEAVQDGLTVTPGSYTNGTAESGDYTANTAALTFTGTKGETKTFTVSTAEDAVLESDETFTLGLTASDAPAGTSVTDTDTGTGTIKNEDSSEVTIADADADEGDDITFTVTLSEAVEGGVTVTPDFTDGTAAEGTDYDENTAAITFTGTKGETQTFTVSTTEEEVLEADETFTVGLTASDAPAGTSVTDTDEATGTVNNDDAAEVTIADAKADEGDAITFTVTLSKAVQGGLTVTPDFTDTGTYPAVEGTDYDENTAALTFTGTANETKSFTVSTTEDAVFEGDETFTVGLTASDVPTGTTVTDTDEATGTIGNDDSAEVTIDDAEAEEGESMTFTVTLDNAVQDGLTVTPKYTDVTAVEGTDYDENTTALTFTGTKGETKTFTVSTTEDAVVEHPETFTVGLTVSKAPPGVKKTDTGTGTINNDDSAEVSISDGSASEGEGINFTVTLSAAVQDGLTVTPGYTDGTAVEGTDYDANTTPISFSGTANETKTFTVSTDEDEVLEGNETFTVSLTVSDAPDGVTAPGSGSNAVSAKRVAFASSQSGVGGVGMINNDDSAEVTIDDAHAEEGNAMTFTVTLSAAVQGGLTVTPGYSNGSAAGSDYTENTTPLSFAGTKGETQKFRVLTTHDKMVEDDETFTVDLTVTDAPVGVTAPVTGTGTIDNNDLRPAVTLTGPSDTQSGAFEVEVTFADDVTGFEKGDLSVSNGSVSTVFGSGTDYAVAIIPAASGTVTIEVPENVAADDTGDLNTASNPLSVEVEVAAEDPGDGSDTAPTVGVSGPSDAQTGAFDVTVTFSEAVTGFEQSEVSVRNGSATAFSGSGDSYSATITPARSGTVTVSIAGGVAEDEDGNGNSTLPTPYTVAADLEAPSVTVSGPAAAQTAAFDVTITFSESVNGFEQSEVSVGNGSVTAFSVSGAAYTATITPAADGEVTVDVAAGVAEDAAGHGNSAAARYSVQVDLGAPSVSLSGPSAAQTGAFDVTVTFSESVSGFEQADVSVGNGSVSSLSGSGAAYTATVSPSASGTVTVDVAADAATDGAGQGNSAASQYSVQADLEAPSVSLSGPSAAQTGAFDVTVTFSESVSGFEQSDVSVGNGSVTAFSGTGSSYTATVSPAASGTVTVDVAANAATDASGQGNSAASQYSVQADLDPPSVTLSGPSALQTGAFDVTVTFSESVSGFEQGDISVGNGSVTAFSGSGSSYTATVSPSADGAVTVDVAADAATDAAGQGNTAASQYSVQADLEAPSVTVSGPAKPQGGPFSVTLLFSEAVTGFEQGDVTVGNGTANLSGSGSVYTARITPSASGTVTVDVAADAAQDAAGRGNRAAAQYSVQADLAGPSVTLSGPAASQGGPFDVTVTFSEAVTGFDASEVTVGNGTANLSGSGSVYTARITPSASGEVTVDVAADVAQDADGRGNSAAARYSVQADLVAPSVTLGGPAGPVAGVFDVTVTFSEAVTGFEQSDLSVGNGSVTGFSGSGASYTAAVTPAADGAVTVDVAAGAATDAHGHDNSAAATWSVQADLTAPSVTLSGPAGPVAGVFDVSVTFSEAVTGFEQGDISAGNGSVTAFSGAGSSYTATITPSASGTVTVDVAADAAEDAAGHGNRAASRYSVQADLVAPSVTVSGPAGPVAGSFDVSVTFSEAVSGFEQSDLSAGNGSVTGFSGSGSSYAATIAPSASGTVTVDVAADAATDANGHGNSAAVRYAVEADLDAPSVSLSGPQSVEGIHPFNVSVTFSEAVTGFAQNDISVSNGSVSGFSGSGSIYTAAVTPAADGTVTVTVAADAARDRVGRGNSNRAELSVQVVVAVTIQAVNQTPVFGGSPGAGNDDGPGGDSVTGGVNGSAPAQRRAAENTPAGTAVGAPVTAADPDGDQLTYTLSGADAASFDLDADSGQLRTRAALDYEARTSYAVTVEATDAHGAAARQAVTIAVTDEDEPPAAPAAPQVTGTSLTSLTVSWTGPATPDRPAVSGYDVQYRVAGSGAAFADAGHEGAGTSLVLKDLKADTEYEAQVRAVNDEGAGPWSASGTGSTLKNAGPVFASGSGDGQDSGSGSGSGKVTGNGSSRGGGVERTAAENTPAGEAVGAPVAATDADGDKLTYALSGADAAAFDLDADSGQLRTRAALDYEARATYAVTVEATDAHGAAAGQAVTIAVTDEAEPPAAPEAPAVSAVSAQSLSLSWTAPETPDRPAVSGYDVQYRIAGGGAAFADAGHEGDQTTLLLKGLAADTEYEAQVRAVNDEGAGAWSASGTGRTNSAPLAGDDAATVAEGGSVRIEVLANDSASNGAALSVRLLDEPLHGTVEVDAAGVVTYVHDGSETAADRFGYKADDGTALSATATVTLTVTPVNDPPVAEAGPDQEADEGAAVTLSGSGTDPEGETLTFAWTQSRGPAVALSEAAAAAPSFTAPAQLAADTTLVFELVVADASGAASAPDAVTVAVRASVDDPPVFAGPYAFELEENQDGRSAPVALGRVEATDPEGGAVTYALTDSGETPRFALDAASGELSYIGPGEDAEAVDEHLLTVEAADAGGLTASVEVTVAVLDVDEPGVVTLSAAEPVVGQTVTATLVDPDGEVTGAAWQWRRSRDGVVWEDIPGATGSSYTLTAADAGMMLSVTVTYTDPHGSSGAAPVSVASDATAAAAEAPGLERSRRLALAAVGRSVAEEVVETLQARMAAGRNGAESHLTVNGQRTVIGEDGPAPAPAPGAAGVGHFAAGQGQGIQPPRVPGPKNPLAGSSFLLSMDDADQWSLWGREATARFDSRPEADFGVDGRLLSGFLGLDYRRTGSNTGIGLALAHNRGEVDYTDYTRAADAGSAGVTLTNLLPYLHWNPAAGLNLWSLGGYGVGTVDMDGLRSLGLRMAAAGARWDLRSLGRVGLAAKTDAFAVQLRPEEGAAADARRLRLALEGRTRWLDHDGNTWQPALELGLRWDGGDADRGAGAELAAELAYANLRHGFDLEARARRLLAHQGDGFRMWGASLVLRRESGNRRGLQLALGPNWGEGDSQVQRLWQGDLQAAEEFGAGPETPSWRPDEMTLSSGYGLVVSRTGRLTPFVEAGAGHRPRLQVGARWEWNDEGNSQIEIYGEQRGAPGDETDRGIQIRGVFNQ